MTKAAILQKGMPLLDKLAEETEAIVNASHPQLPNLDTCEWEHVAGLYEVAASIKGLSTPVFGSKLCHFILPDVFPVIDWDFIGVSADDYRGYWEFCKTEWTSCQDRKSLVAVLSPCIESKYQHYFPWSTKITELCIAGSKRSNSGRPQRSKSQPVSGANMKIRDKIFSLFAFKRCGEILTAKQIIDAVVAAYPGTNRVSVIPSDYCYNILNRGIKFDSHIFEQLASGHYKVLGSGYDYEGPVYWKGKKIGEWRKREKRLRIWESITK